MIDLLKRRTIQVQRTAGHTLHAIAELVAVSTEACNSSWVSL